MTTTTAKAYKGLNMEGVIATWYAKNTGKSIEEFRKDARRVAGLMNEGATILEVAPGPGYFAIELAKLGSYDISGLDISATFVDIAQAKAQEAGVKVDFRQGDAARMPFADEIFDFLFCKSAFKNFSAPVQALDEFYRVLKTGGKALILDLRGDASNEALDHIVDADLKLRGFSNLMTKWIFKTSLVKRAYTKQQFNQMAAQSRFKTCAIDEKPAELAVWLEK